MPDEASSPPLFKRIAKSQWRGKMFAHDEKAEKEAAEDNISDFLRPSVSKPAYHLPTEHPAQQLGRIDTSSASRWPNAKRIIAHGALTSCDPTRSNSGCWKRKKKDRHVRFSDEEPAIIGEGGDDAEAPPMAVNRASSLRTPAMLPAHPSGPPADLLPQHSTLPSASSDLEENGLESISSLRSSNDESERQASPGDVASGYIARIETGADRPDHHPRRFASAAADMRAEEGRTLTAGRLSSSIGGEDGASSLDLTEPRVRRNDPPPHRKPVPPLAVRPSSPPTSLYSASSHQSSAQESQKPGSAASEPPSAFPIPAAQTPVRHSVESGQFGSVTRAVAWGEEDAAPEASGKPAIESFAARTMHLSRVFQLAAEKGRPAFEVSFADWIRAGAWWFLRSRCELEKAIRRRPKERGGMQSGSAATNASYQSFVDLAKAWWILHSVAPVHPEPRRYGDGSLGSILSLAKQYGDHRLAELIDTHQDICAKFDALATSMERNDFLPPGADEPLLALGLDTSIWVDYPSLTPHACSLLSGTRSPSVVVHGPPQSHRSVDYMPLGDTTKMFHHASMVVGVVLSEEESPSPAPVLPCMLSILRERVDWQIRLVIASQNELVNLSVQSDKRAGFTWEDVVLNDKQARMTVNLAARGLKLNVHFHESDFSLLGRICENSRKVRHSQESEEDEELVFETTLKDFHYVDSNPHPTVFAARPVPGCPLRLFVKTKSQAEGAGVRTTQCGYRLVVATRPQIKMIGSINQRLDDRQVIRYGFARSAHGPSPAGFWLNRQKNGKPCSTRLTFQTDDDRSRFFSLLTDSFTDDDEAVQADVPLKGLVIEGTSQLPTVVHAGRQALQALDWSRIRVINRSANPRPRATGHAIRFESLRICAEGRLGTLTDRVNLGPGQLYIRLEVGQPTELRIYRQPQDDDVRLAVAEADVPALVRDSVSELLGATGSSATTRIFTFHTVPDLHAFQGALTGFAVVFDRVVSSFAILRRRMVVPLHKKWEASRARLQVVQQPAPRPRTQLLVFFHDFSHGSCMSVQLKSTDVYEAFGRSSGKLHVVCLVDAKFALPRLDPGAGSRDFVSLDAPEYAAEHDDIQVTFESKHDSDAALRPSV
ncbi:MAG: hypothetical protein M1826_002527 [Phylliscum demangeonii]|nr:MAG: hypothetical protein M1826_002527 [Phylliscum demangeonii]